MDHAESVKMFGAVAGLAMLAGNRSMSEAEAESLLSGYAGAFVGRAVAEAESELKKLEQVISRMKTLASGIASADRIRFNDPRIAQMASSAKALDGWTVSLLETNYTVIGILEGMMTFNARAATLSMSLQSLWATRFQSGSFFKDSKMKMVF